MLSSLRTLFDLLLLLGVALGALISALGLIGAFVPLFDIFNHFQLLIMFSSLAAFAISFVWPFKVPKVKHLGRLLLAIPVVISTGTIAFEFSKRAMVAELSREDLQANALRPLKVMSFNVYLGTWARKGLARSIIQHRPEVVALQEYAPNRFKRQPDLKKHYPHQSRCQSWRRCTLAILSKHRLSDRKRYALGAETSSTIMHGKMLAATVHIKGRDPVRVYNVHMSWPLPVAQQQAQLAAMAEIILKERKKTPQQIVMGDFNSTGWAYSVDRFAAKAELERRSHFLPSFPSPLSRMKGLKLPAFLSLDHILTSPNVGAGQIVRAKASVGDHWPIIGNVYLPK